MTSPSLVARLPLLAAALMIAATRLHGQDTPVVCQVASVALQVRAEGRAERVGDITIECRGGTPGQAGRTNLVLFLNRNITNPVVSNVLRDATLSLDQGSGLRPVPVGAVVQSNTALSFNGIDFTVPANRLLVFRISQLRADVSGLNQPVTATLSFNGTGGLSLNQNVATVAQPVTGLLVSGALSQIRCVLSRFPEELTFAAALAEGTAFFTGRATEGFETAFSPREAGADQGTRLVVRYAGFPADARLAVPDLVAGSSAPSPTSAGDFGMTVSPGAYAAGSLLLVRVVGTDANGAGGVLVNTLGQAQFGALREVGLTNGQGIAAYEVVDASTVIRESVQIPTFLDLRRLSSEGPVFANAKISLGPISATPTSSTAVPRFADIAAPNDCGAVRDCGAGYFPQLLVDPSSVTQSAPQDAGAQVQYVRVLNDSGGILNWTATVNFVSGGSNWLRIDRTSGINNTTIRLDFLPGQTPGPGTYQANLLVDAGSTGSRTVPVSFTVTARQTPIGPVVDSVTHAATFEEQLVPGSLAMLRGARLNGANITVKLNETTARTLFTAADQINFEVPASLAGLERADLVVSAGGVDSQSRSVRLSPVLPGIFAGGVVNASGAANSTTNPARIGSVVRLLVTGIPTAALNSVRVRLHDWEGMAPLTAAPLPDLPSVQYVDVLIPWGMPGITSNIVVCASSQAGAPAVCSLPAKISMVE